MKLVSIDEHLKFFVMKLEYPIKILKNELEGLKLMVSRHSGKKEMNLVIQSCKEEIPQIENAIKILHAQHESQNVNDNEAKGKKCEYYPCDENFNCPYPMEHGEPDCK